MHSRVFAEKQPPVSDGQVGAGTEVERSGGLEEVRSLDGKAMQYRDIKMGGYGSDLDFSTGCLSAV